MVGRWRADLITSQYNAVYNNLLHCLVSELNHSDSTSSHPEVVANQIHGQTAHLSPQLQQHCRTVCVCLTFCFYGLGTDSPSAKTASKFWGFHVVMLEHDNPWVFGIPDWRSQLRLGIVGWSHKSQRFQPAGQTFNPEPGNWCLGALRRVGTAHGMGAGVTTEMCKGLDDLKIAGIRCRFLGPSYPRLLLIETHQFHQFHGSSGWSPE